MLAVVRLRQNLEETGTVAPHDGHGRDSAVPQLGQKVAESETCEPHEGHVVMRRLWPDCLDGLTPGNASARDATRELSPSNP